MPRCSPHSEKKIRSAGCAAIFRALPLPFHVFRLLALPGVRALSDSLYDAVAARRYVFSEWLGYTSCGLKRVTPEPVVVGREIPPPWRVALRKTARVTSNTVAGIVFFCILWDSYNLNIAYARHEKGIEEPDLVRAIIEVPQLEHAWQLFAPDPLVEDGWWVIEGVTESGKMFDPLTGREPTWEKPKDIRDRYDRYWRKYLGNLWQKGNSEHRLWFGKYITIKNHREMPKGERLERFNFYYVLELTQPPGTPEPFPTQRIILSRHECFGQERE